MTPKTKTILEMAMSLSHKAQEKGVSLDGLTIDNFNCYLDDAFDDGGEVRCEYFTDLADPYALLFGPLESIEYDAARWECIEAAIEMVADARKIAKKYKLQ